ncbi:MAG: hypothetical protein H0W27_07425 [Actinobacteria bacterium]|nr:hypothetical protein [Actinomycetota bacterium]
MSQRRIFQNETVYLPDLARTGTIVSATFTDCDIRGPAVVHLLGESRMEGVGFRIEHNDPETIMWELPEGAYKIGLIGLQGCRVNGGRFEGVGFAGTKEQLDTMRRAIAAGK